MSKKTDRIVYRRSDGKWVNKRCGAKKASSLHNTQANAEAAARRMLKNQGGGELITKGLNGKIRIDVLPAWKARILGNTVFTQR